MLVIKSQNPSLHIHTFCFVDVLHCIHKRFVHIESRGGQPQDKVKVQEATGVNYE